MRTRDRRIVAAGAGAAGLVWTGAGTAAADRSSDATGDPSERAYALFVDEATGAVVDVTVQEVAGSATTVEVLLFLEGLHCTVDVDRVDADITRLESARAAGTYDYTCSDGTGGGEGTAPAPSGVLALDVTWTGVGAPVKEPLYDGSVGRFVVRPAEVSGTVSLTGDPSADLRVNSAHLARESTVVPPGRVR